MTSREAAAVALGSQVTIYEVAELRDRLAKDLEQREELLLDGHAVREVDAAGIQLLLYLAGEATRLHKTLGLWRPSDVLQEMVQLLHVERALPEVTA